jgi:hypothetical protein
LSITPATGKALAMKFLFTATSWTDPDIPLKYQFFYSADGITTPFSFKQYPNKKYSILPGKGSSTKLSILVYVYDLYGAKSKRSGTVSVTPSAVGFGNALKNI